MAVFGDTLRQARAHKGVTLKEAEQTTRINRHHLLALEEEKFDDLPPLIYQRGIVRNYSMYLGLDPNRVLSLFEEARGVAPHERQTVLMAQPMEMPNHWAPNFAIIAFLVVMSAVVFAWMYSAYFAPDGAESTPTEIIPTLTPANTDTLFPLSPTIQAPTEMPTQVEQVAVAVSPTALPQPTALPTVEQKIDVAEEEPIEAPTEVPELAPAEDVAGTGQVVVTFRADAEIASLQVVADGVLVYDGALGLGDQTGFLAADTFEVYVSDPLFLTVIKENGEAFNMGDSQYFQLP